MATKKTNLKVAEPKTPEWCIDEAKIKEFSKKIVDRALAPNALMDYVTNFLSDENPEEAEALRAAIDKSYPAYCKEYDKTRSDDSDLQLHIIEQQVYYYIGLEVGRRVSRD